MQSYRGLYKHKLLTIVSFIFLIIFYSCNKKDKINPVVVINTPSGGAYSVSDSIFVDAHISDNESIKLVSVYIISQNNQRVSPDYTYTLDVKNYHLQTKYPIDNIYLESDSYYLVIEARDEYNTVKKYVSIQIGALGRVLKDVLIVERENQTTSLYSIMNDKTLLKTFNDDYQDLIYNPYAEQYLFLTSSGVLKSYDDKTFEEQWFKNGLNNPSKPFYGSLFYKDKLSYVSTAQNELRAYNKNGLVSKQANAIDLEGQISNYVFHEDKIMLIKKPYTNGFDRIERLNEVTGASVRTYSLDFSPERILFVDDELCLVLGNENNIAKACSLSTYYNVIHPIEGLGNRAFNDAYKYSTYMYVLALDNKIVEYNLVNANERELDLTNAAIKFFYEDISGRLYYTDGKNLAYLRYPNTGHVDVFENDKTIDDLIFIYNK